MAKIYLDSGDIFTINNGNAFVYGSLGTERVAVDGSVSGLTIDQNVEAISFSGTKNSYSYQQSGNQLLIYSGSTLCCRAALQDDNNGTQLTFSDVSVEGKISAAGMTLGGVSILDISSGGNTDTGSGSNKLAEKAVLFSVSDNDTGIFLGANDSKVAPLLSGGQWRQASVSYGFNNSLPAEYYGVTEKSTVSGDLVTNWSPLNIAEKNSVKSVAASIANIITLPVVETNTSVNSIPDIRFNVVPMVTSIAGFAYLPSSSGTNVGLAGDVFLASSNRDTEKYTAGDQGYLTVVHELGHALGLKHPFEAPNTLISSLDSTAYTVMSYTSARNQYLNFSYEGSTAKMASQYVAPFSYGVLDTAALQVMYGANLGYHTTADTYTVSTNKHQYVTVWDAGGVDNLDASYATGSCKIDLRAGSLSSVDIHTVAEQQEQTQAYYRSLGVDADTWVANVYSQNASKVYTGENNLGIAYGVWLENVTTGSNSDTVHDNAVNNLIKTGAGNDVIELYEGGMDTVDGGAGVDSVRITNSRSQVQIEKQTDGSYWLLGTYFSAQLIGIEQIQFSDVSMSLT